MTKREWEAMTRRERRQWYLETIKGSARLLAVFVIAAGLPNWMPNWVG